MVDFPPQCCCNCGLPRGKVTINRTLIPYCHLLLSFTPLKISLPLFSLQSSQVISVVFSPRVYSYYFVWCLLLHSRSRTSFIYIFLKKAQECEIHEGIQPRAGPVQIIFGPKSLSTIISQLHLRQSLPFWVEADGGARCVSEGAFPAHCGPSLHVAFASHGAGQNRAGSGVTSSTSERAGLVLKSMTIFRAIAAKSLSISCG